MDGSSVVRPRSYFIGAATAELAAVSNSAALPESPFVGIVSKALPAVVFIDVRKKSGAEPGDAGDEILRHFFDSPSPRRQQRTPSSGSGFRRLS